MLRHFYGLYSHRPKLSSNQRSRIRLVIVKKGVERSKLIQTNLTESDFELYMNLTL